MTQRLLKAWLTLAILGAASLFMLAGCSQGADQPAPEAAGGVASEDPAEDTRATEAEMLTLPDLTALPLDGRPLRVVATTSIIGDVVGRVGGDAIELTTLMAPGQDPHSYQPAAADLTAAANADIIFVNGWNLEEGLVADLATIGENAVLVPVSAGISPLAFGEDEQADEDEGEAHEQGAADPHTWLAVENVSRWAGNVAEVLSALDPANSGRYLGNAVTYQDELSTLDVTLREQLAAIPENKRVLVTNHDAFGYFAAAYGFDVLGTIIPGASTLSEPTASDLAALISAMQDEDVCAIFSESTGNERLGQTVAAELDNCDVVQVLQLYSGALGRPGSGAESYIGMMQANVATIVSGLR